MFCPTAQNSRIYLRHRSERERWILTEKNGNNNDFQISFWNCCWLFPVDRLSSVYLWPLIICHIYKLVQPKKRCFISFVWIISKRLVTKIHPVVKNLECFETFSLCFSFIFHFQFPVVTQMYVCAYVLVGFRTETSCYGFRKTGSVALIASVWSLR